MPENTRAKSVLLVIFTVVAVNLGCGSTGFSLLFKGISHFQNRR